MKPAHKYILRHNLLLLTLFTVLGSLLYVLVRVFGEQVVGKEIIPATLLAYGTTVLVVNFW